MRRPALLLLLAAACASSDLRGPTCSTPADRVEVRQVQIGWQRLDRALEPPVVDPRITMRSPEEAEALARQLLVRCRTGEPMERLQGYSEVPPGSVVVGPKSNVPFRAAALCMQKNDCAAIRSNVAFHVLKRVN